MFRRMIHRTMQDQHLEIKMLPDNKHEEFDRVLKLNLKKQSKPIEPVEIAVLASMFVQKIAGAIGGIIVLKTICRIAEKRLS